MEKKFLKYFKEYFVITLGCFIYAFSINYFFVANKFAEGGAAGICLIFFYLFKFPISITYLVLNIPLLIVGWKFVGKEFLIKTIYGTFCLSGFIALTSTFHGPNNDPLLSAIYGGISMGAGLGMIFLVDGSTGGTDIIAMICKKYFNLPMGRTMLTMDTCILTASAFVVGIRIIMYTLIAVVLVSKTIDFFQEGLKKSKGVTIVSYKYEEIKDAIMSQTGRGTTLIRAEGGYTRNYLPLVYCVVTKFELGKIKNIVADIDENAFVTVTDVSEVLGEGFYPLRGVLKTKKKILETKLKK